MYRIRLPAHKRVSQDSQPSTQLQKLAVPQLFPLLPTVEGFGTAAGRPLYSAEPPRASRDSQVGQPLTTGVLYCTTSPSRTAQRTKAAGGTHLLFGASPTRLFSLRGVAGSRSGLVSEYVDEKTQRVAMKKPWGLG